MAAGQGRLAVAMSGIARSLPCGRVFGEECSSCERRGTSPGCPALSSAPGPRSALRADCTALLAAGAHGRTRSAAYGRYAQTCGRELDERSALRAPPPLLRCSSRPFIGADTDAGQPGLVATTVGRRRGEDPGRFAVASLPWPPRRRFHSEGAVSIRGGNPAPRSGFSQPCEDGGSEWWLRPAGAGNKTRWRAAQGRGRRAQRASSSDSRPHV